jgi:hypothetical protein
MSPENNLGMELPEGFSLKEKDNFISLSYKDEEMISFDKEKLTEEKENIENCVCKCQEYLMHSGTL